MNLRTSHEVLPIYGEAGLFLVQKIINDNKSRGRVDKWGKKLKKNVLTSGLWCGTIIVEIGHVCGTSKIS